MVAEMVDTEPGGRSRSSRAIVSRAGYGVADPDARQREGLGERSDRDEVRVPIAERDDRAAGVLVVRLVDDDHRGACAEARDCVQDGHDFGLGLVAARRIVGHSQPDDLGLGQPGEDGRHVERKGGLWAEPGNDQHASQALGRQDAVHAVGRDGHDGRPARREEGLGDDVEHLVGTGADEDLRGLDPGVRSGRRCELRILRVRILVQAGIEWPAEHVRQPAGRDRRGVGVEADDVLGPDAVARGDGLVRRLPGVDLGGARPACGVGHRDGARRPRWLAAPAPVAGRLGLSGRRSRPPSCGLR